MREYISLMKLSSTLQMVWGVAVIISIMMLCFGVAFPQPPFSDFEIHWDQSKDLNNYIKGGLSALIYKFVSVFTKDDWITALIVNLISWVVFVYAIQPTKRDIIAKIDKDVTLKIVFAACLFFYGFWWVSISSTVAIFSVHLAFFAVGTKMALVYGKKTTQYWVLAIIILAFAFSMRMQTVLAIFVGIGLILPCFLANSFIKKKSPLIGLNYVNRRFIVVLTTGIVLGVIAEMALRQQSANDAEISRSQRAQLYNGLFEPFSKPNHCGGWTQSNWDLAMEELDIPILQLFKKYLPKNSPSFYLEAAICKYSRLTKSEVYVWWVPRINYDNWRDGSVLQQYDSLKDYVRFNNFMLKLCLIFLMCYVLFKLKKHTSPGTELNFSIILGLIILFGILEFNFRYTFILIGYFLIYFGLKFEANEITEAQN